MTLIIPIGWWLLPLSITILSFVAASLMAGRQATGHRSGPDYFGTGALFDGIVWLLWMAGASIVSLISWLVWAVLT